MIWVFDKEHFARQRLKIKALLLCGVVGTEVGIPLVRLSPI